MRALIALLLLPTILIAAETSPDESEASSVVEPSADVGPALDTSDQDVITQVRDSSLGLTIKGNQELPNVLYIVPWQRGLKNDVSPIQGRIVEEVYGPTEISVFKRRVRLYRSFHQTNFKPTDEQNPE